MCMATRVESMLSHKFVAEIADFLNWNLKLVFYDDNTAEDMFGA